MLKRVFGMCVLSVLYSAQAAAEFTEVIAPEQLASAERTAITDTGRVFVIGVLPAETDAQRGVVSEIVRGDRGYELRSYVHGNLEGTLDGTLNGAPAGDACVFSGMTRFRNVVYAACYASDGRTSLIAVDTEKDSVRAGYFTSCNDEPSVLPCTQTMNVYPNGMATDAAGRIYYTNMFAHLDIAQGQLNIDTSGTGTLHQVTVEEATEPGPKLAFKRRPWFGSDILRDSYVPNGVQIEGSSLYYAAGPNINRIEIEQDGRAGAVRTYYVGAALSYIDDFAVKDGELLLSQLLLTQAVVRATPGPSGMFAVRSGSEPLDLMTAPSSVTNLPEGNNVFPQGGALVTSWVGGGVYLLQGF